MKNMKETWTLMNKKNKNKTITEMIKDNQAMRFNTGKLKWNLVDFKALEPMVQVLEFGAKKYASHNWKKGLPTDQICDSMLRHIYAYLNGEDNDPESGISHIGHILCNAMFLSHMQLQKGEEWDTRFKGHE